MKVLFLVVCFGLFLGLVICMNLPIEAVSAERVKFATSTPTYPVFYLPPLAAEEGGFWKENGLDVEWVPFQGGTALNQAIAAGSITIGISGVSTSLQGIVLGGLPIVYVSHLYSPDEFIFWVRADSAIKEPGDLKGSKIGVTRFGGGEHSFGLYVVRALNLENDVKFVATSGVTEGVAALKSKAVDVIVMPPEIMIMLKMAGEVRELVYLTDYIPKPWASNIIFTTKDFLMSKPSVVKSVVKSILQATNFIRKNPRWAIDKMKATSGFSEEAATYVYEKQSKLFTIDGKIDPKSIENVKEFMINYKLIPREKTPAVNDILRLQF